MNVMALLSLTCVLAVLERDGTGMALELSSGHGAAAAPVAATAGSRLLFHAFGEASRDRWLSSCWGRSELASEHLCLNKVTAFGIKQEL